jgi:hypothetical protein
MRRLAITHLVVLVLTLLKVESVLRHVTILSRHGVRGPYGPNGLAPTSANLERYSKKKYPFPVTGLDWGTSENATELVTPKITKHGQQVIQNMGQVLNSIFVVGVFIDEIHIHLCDDDDDDETDEYGNYPTVVLWHVLVR